MVALIAAWCPGAWAMEVALDLDTATRLSDVVVQGKVLDTSARWEADARGNHIYTYATVRTAAYLKGTGAAQIVVEFPGGTAGGITEVVSDTAAIQAGEDVVLLLKRAEGRIRPAVGTYSKYSVEEDVVRGATGSSSLSAFVSAVQAATGASGVKVEPDSAVHPLPAPAAGEGDPITEFSLLPLFGETFEGLFPGSNWDLSGTVIPPNGDPTTWLDTNYTAHGGAWSGWCAGTTEDPASGYVDNMDAWMVYGPFNLSDAVDANVTFWLNLDSEPSADYFRYYASIDGSNFSGYRLSGNTGGWVSRTFDLKSVGSLGNLCGQSQVWIAFRFTSSSSVSGPTYKGAFLDDIQINKDTGGSGGSVPVISSIGPNPASAGTNTAVTITGSNFGTSGTVQFFYKSGQPTIPGAVTSWTNTQIVCTVPTGVVNGYSGSAASGPVTVVNASGTSNAYTFRVSFGYGGMKWPGTSTGFKVNPACTSCATVLEGVRAAAGAWNVTGSAFRLRYDGATTATTSSSNSINEIVWGTLSSPTTIAQATYWSIGATIVETDIVFNNGDFTWSTTGSASGMDVQTIAAHELGHWLNLRDLYGDIGDGINDAGKVMYGYGWEGKLLRSPTAADHDGIVWIYGAGWVGDINGDGHVNATDLPYLSSSFGLAKSSGGFNPDCDFNGNGKVNVVDLLTLAGNWGK